MLVLGCGKATKRVDLSGRSSRVETAGAVLSETASDVEDGGAECGMFIAASQSGYHHPYAHSTARHQGGAEEGISECNSMDLFGALQPPYFENGSDLFVSQHDDVLQGI